MISGPIKYILRINAFEIDIMLKQLSATTQVNAKPNAVLGAKSDLP